MVFALLLNTTTADDITLSSPDNADSCVTGPSVELEYLPLEDSLTACHLYHNNTGSHTLERSNYSITVDQYNYFSDDFDKATILWEIECANDTTTFYVDTNYTFTVTDKPYCAVLSDVSCTGEVRKGSDGVFKFRLSNTRSQYLENQDCNIWIEDSDGDPVKAFNTMMSQQDISSFVDEEGNWVNINPVKVPLTDSQGWYVFEFGVEGDKFWYGDNYTIHGNCNGENVSCEFTVTEHRMPDTNEWKAIGKKYGGLVLVGIIFLGVSIVFVFRFLRGIKFMGRRRLLRVH